MGKKRPAKEETEEVDDAGEEGMADVAVAEDNSADSLHWTRETIVPLPLDGIGKNLKIVSWNVNGLKALVSTKLQVLTSLVATHSPDIICFQETKIQDNTIDNYADLLNGYEAFWNCSTVKKGYAGTAVFMKKDTISVPSGLRRSGSSHQDGTAEGPAAKKQAKLSSFFQKNVTQPVVAASDAPAAASASTATTPGKHVSKVLNVSYDFEDENRCHHGEGRTITVEFDSFILVACYVPNSGEGLRRLDYRIDEWEPHMRTYLRTLSARKPVVYTGDLNVGHLDLDIHNPTAKHIVKQAGLTPAERSAFGQMLTECNFRDAFRHFHPDARGQFTYWSQRLFHRAPNKGIRLDYFICSHHMFPPAAGAEKGEKGAAADAAVVVHDSYILHEDTVTKVERSGLPFVHHPISIAHPKMDDETKFVVRFGCGSTVGGRPYQEDRLVATRLNGSADQTFFAVFDGHGGDRCSEFLSRNFFKELMAHPKFGTLTIVALQETWAAFDDKCLSALKRVEAADPQRIMPGDGSTATVCLVSYNDIYLTNCGDSAAYAIHQDGRTELLTEDHGTNNQEEVARCIKAGGALKPQFYYAPYPFPFCFVGRSLPAKPRMLPGGLLVTRSFGDFNSKLEYLGGKKGVVISTHGKISYINAGKTPPKYLILASDGVWDVLTIQEVSQMLDTFLEKRALLGPATSSSCQPLPTDTAAAISAAGPTAPSGVKLSPHKVYPETAQPSHADLSEAQSTFQQVHSELINARYSDLSADLNEAATFIVKFAAASPKWKALGCTADNTSMIIVAFTPKASSDASVPETV